MPRVPCMEVEKKEVVQHDTLADLVFPVGFFFFLSVSLFTAKFIQNAGRFIKQDMTSSTHMNQIRQIQSIPFYEQASFVFFLSGIRQETLTEL